MMARKKIGPGALWAEIAGLAGLLATAGYFLTVSWRKWNHPLIDFGRELYVPWRLSEGAVLYRDVDDVYGPFSQYFNAGLFKLFGPGLMVLVTANLEVFAAILALSYALFRRAWGVTGALMAGGVFVSVFAFARLLPLPNFNFATPYAHEATHGILVCLGLVAVLGRWLDQPTRRLGFFAGWLVGLTLVIKLEFIFAAGAVTAAAWFLRWRKSGNISMAGGGSFVLGALLPTLAFAIYFGRYFPLAGALEAAGRAWTSLFTQPELTGNNYQQIVIGLDHPWANLLEHLQKTLLVLVTLAALGGLIAFALRRTHVAARWGLLALTAGLAWVAGSKCDWGYVGRCLLGLNLLYLGLAVSGRLRRSNASEAANDATVDRRLLLGVLAAALMGRMLLNGRIVQYGFFQAAVAAMVVVAVLSAESAEWMPAGPGRRRAVLLVTGALLLPGIMWCSNYSQPFLRAQTFAVGEGRDRFYTFPPEIDATGYLINAVLEILRPFPAGSVLFTLPEGEMINYLARRPGPLPQFQFYAFTTEGGRESVVVKALDAHPPDLVVIASRDLHDYGIAHYGERDGAGRQIVQWLGQHYQITHQIGPSPLESDQPGAYVLQRKPAEAAKN